MSSNTSGFSAGFQPAITATDKLVNLFSGLGPQIVAALSIGGVTAAFKDQIDRIIELSNAADFVGVEVGELQAFEFAAQRIGRELDDVTGLFEEFQIRIGDANRGAGTALPVFNELGLDLDRLANTDAVSALKIVGREIEKLEKTERIFALDQLFGGDGPKLNAFFANFTENLESSETALRRFNGVLTETDVTAVRELRQEFALVRSFVELELQGTIVNLSKALDFSDSRAGLEGVLGLSDNVLKSAVVLRLLTNDFFGFRFSNLLPDSEDAAQEGSKAGRSFAENTLAQLQKIQPEVNRLFEKALDPLDKNVRSIERLFEIVDLHEKARKPLDDKIVNGVLSDISEDILKGATNLSQASNQFSEAMQALKNSELVEPQLTDAASALTKSFEKVRETLSQQVFDNLLDKGLFDFDETEGFLRGIRETLSELISIRDELSNEDFEIGVNNVAKTLGEQLQGLTADFSTSTASALEKGSVAELQARVTSNDFLKQIAESSKRNVDAQGQVRQILADLLTEEQRDPLVIERLVVPDF